jgi:hypothetical protein
VLLLDIFVFGKTLKPHEQIVVVSLLYNYDVEIEQQFTFATESFCQNVIDDESCPMPNRILCNMILHEEGHRLGLKAALTHQLLEVGLQKHHGLPAPAELGMHD